jgi:uncharacterized membrane protein YbhN (UPF0104 family)
MFKWPYFQPPNINNGKILMETVPSQKRKSALRKTVELSLKVIITVACFWYISTKIDFVHVWQALLKANWWLLLVAILFYTLSKIISSYRLNINFRNINLHLSEWENLKLYWLGMFYNLFLPGAISGDAYKVIILNKTHKAPYKKTSPAVLLDRFSGLLGLGALLSVYGLLVLNATFNLVLITGAVLSILIFYLLIRTFFKEFLQGFASTFLLGILVQTIQVNCVYCIMLSLQIPLSQSEWVFIFLASSAISVLPISLGGGLGTREVVFAEGARFFHMKPELGVIISLLFYLNNLLSSVWGLFFVFKDPIKKATWKGGF